jgi:hypothetical protein
MAAVAGPRTCFASAEPLCCARPCPRMSVAAAARPGCIPSRTCGSSWGAPITTWTARHRPRGHRAVPARWLQDGRRDQPSTVSRRLSVVVGFYRDCVIDQVLPHPTAEYVRRPSVPARHLPPASGTRSSTHRSARHGGRPIPTTSPFVLERDVQPGTAGVSPTGVAAISPRRPSCRDIGVHTAAAHTAARGRGCRTLRHSTSSIGTRRRAWCATGWR